MLGQARNDEGEASHGQYYGAAPIVRTPELVEIRWINGSDNPTDAVTKADPNKALNILIDTINLTVRVEGWVKRGDGHSLKVVMLVFRTFVKRVVCD